MSRIQASRQRRGAVLVAALICLLVVGVLTISMTRRAVQRYRMMQSHQRQLQAMWLAESGFERAVAQLKQNDEYNGEIWRVSADRDKVPNSAGEVTIAVDFNDFGRLIKVSVRYPDSSPQGVQYRLSRVASEVVPESTEMEAGS